MENHLGKKTYSLYKYIYRGLALHKAVLGMRNKGVHTEYEERERKKQGMKMEDGKERGSEKKAYKSERDKERERGRGRIRSTTTAETIKAAAAQAEASS